jgi:hypothetical protein
LRGILGGAQKDKKEITILGRLVKWTERGITYEADERHRKVVMEHFGFKEGSRELGGNGDKDEKEEPGDDEELEKGEAKVFRGLAARLNFLSLDCPDLQFPTKGCAREMARPTRGSWRGMKKLARYLVGRKRVVWEFRWQDEPRFAHVFGDSDWGGSRKDRKSTSRLPQMSTSCPSSNLPNHYPQIHAQIWAHLAT